MKLLLDEMGFKLTLLKPRKGTETDYRFLFLA